jgi:hypothetical protein
LLNIYLARAAVEAAMFSALVGDPGVAVVARVARGAAAGVRPQARVEARGPILARLVGSAVVQILEERDSQC